MHDWFLPLSPGHRSAPSRYHSESISTPDTLTSTPKRRRFEDFEQLVMLMQAARSASVLATVVPPAMSAQGAFSNANAKFDGFGPGGGVTWRRLEAMLKKANGEQ